MGQKRRAAAGVVAIGVLAGGVAAAATGDWGVKQQQDTESHAMEAFGVVDGIRSSSADDLDAAQATAHPEQLAQLARGLTAKVVTSAAAPNVDMIALWPNDTAPTHLVFCNEQGAAQPGLQRLDLATGDIATILTGTSSCDPVHRTAWGTLVFGEEAGSTGGLYELIDPLHTTDVSLDRTTHLTSGGTNPGNIVYRGAPGNLSYEGVALYDNGVMYYGDENRPSNGNPGGAMYKFVPSTPWAGGTVTTLAESPLTSGTVYGMRLGAGTNHGQGSETGFGAWVPLATGDLRSAAATAHLTGYFRPEDIAIDKTADAAGRVRFCGPMTGDEARQNYGEVVCVTDGTLAAATAGTSVPEAQRLVAGNPQLAMPDNIDHQPGRGNWIVHEDGEVDYTAAVGAVHDNDLWSCLDDGADDDLASDGCIRIATLRDLDAEWTGGVFDAAGRHFYVSVQHNSSGKGVILDITGWR